MFLEQKINLKDQDNNIWQGNATKEVLLAQAKLYNQVRKFFIEREVLEVSTPLMARYSVTDLYLDSFQLANGYFLQTSPEYAMKRLLANGSGCIFQICKAFRDEPASRLHNPEFTMLEWYRVDFDHHDLMQEIDDLLSLVLECEPAKKISYQQIFIEYLEIDPLTCSLNELINKAVDIDLTTNLRESAKFDDLLHILFNYYIEPKLVGNNPYMIFDYPASQAALAKINSQDPRVASRFEVYYQGVELANGYYELQDSKDQYQRFLADNCKREQIGKNLIDIDHRLLLALEHGLPKCAGVAMGMDRLLMLYLKASSIEDVLSFSFSRA